MYYNELHIFQFRGLILLVEYEGDLTLDDFEGVNQSLKAYLATAGHPFHTFSDFSKVHNVPTNLPALTKALTETLPQLSSIVVFGQSMVARVLTDGIARLLHKNIYSVKDFDSALQKIVELDPAMEKLL